jgi:UPF0271 protein
MIDINCDLGESLEFLKTGHDEALMAYIHSVNIACGFHAGDEHIMQKTTENALKHGLNIGAHPGFDDKENFGRTNIELSENQIIDLISIQLESLSKIARKLHHVKPHGALYNMAAKRADYAKAIARAVYDFDSSLILYGLSGSLSISEAQKMGLETRSEVFADRSYLSDGSLAPRTVHRAVLKDTEQIKKQISAFVMDTPFLSLDGTEISVTAETICVHSDTGNALEIAQLVWQEVNQK